MTSGKKDYGLILPNKKFNINEVKRPSIFNNDDSDEDAKDMGTSDWIKKSFQKQAAQNVGVRKQTEIDMKKAIEQDPTVYQYDEIYDDLEKKKLEEEKKKKDDKKKPRYIQSLLRKAEQRKIENERRIERQVQKEREAEGEQFKDKETFVTSSYKKKLEEFSKLDEEERRQDMLEEICDVSKQQDLGGFYRHLYRTTVDRDESKEKKDKKCEPKKDGKNEVVVADKGNSDSTTTDLDKKGRRENRQYRKRKSSESSSLEEGEHHSDDSDTSISSSSSGSSSASSSSSKSSKKLKEKDNVKNKSHSKGKRVKVEEKVSEIITEDKKIDKVKKPEDKNDDSLNTKHNADQDKEILLSSEKVKEEKINIWEKRTVGPLFEGALQRYFQRKAERQAMRGN